MRIVFLVGAGRSGTTWLQEMLGRHPSIVTGQESHIAPRYLEPMWRTWTKEASLEGGDLRHVGICNYVTEGEFVVQLRQFTLGVLGRLRDAKPSASLILEKTPRHVEYLELIRRLFPECSTIHLVRDPRAVVASYLDAARGWGKNWALPSAKRAVDEWRRAVLAAKEHAGQTDRYIEVRYEDLHRNTRDVLARVLCELDVEPRPGLVQSIVSDTRFGTMKGGKGTTSIMRVGEVRERIGVVAEPEGFYNKGEVNSWRQSLSARDIRVVERTVGELMADFGYEVCGAEGSANRFPGRKIRLGTVDAMHQVSRLVSAGVRKVRRR